jgi:hypothetical protein
VKRTLLALALAIIFVLALAAPAFAMYHAASVTMDGTINFKSQAGHACNTGGVMKQTIAGSGTLDKVMTILMVPGKLTVNDSNNWVAGATPLTVTSVWELCTPPKYTYDGKVTLSGKEIDVTAPVSIKSIYDKYGNSPSFNIQGFTTASAATPASMAKANGWDALTDQIWAVQVQADPGFSGNLSQKGEAAYGSFWRKGADGGYYDFEAGWTGPELSGALTVDKKGTWRWEKDKDGLGFASVGANYVGDYFTMEQHARTSQGTLRRYVDISSPWSHGYLHLDMSVVGKSDIKDAFAMNNLPAGKDVPKDWWRLF